MMMQASRRPKRLADLAAHALAHERQELHRGTVRGALWREFLDSFYGMPDAERAEALEDEPVATSSEWDAWLAATAEQLCLDFKLPKPPWINAPTRFLAKPRFAMGGVMKGVLLAESPPAFRRRGFFVSGNVLTLSSMLQAHENHGEAVPQPHLARFIAAERTAATAGVDPISALNL